jgi:uncharacterized protein YjbI with pentapeptide repeats
MLVQFFENSAQIRDISIIIFGIIGLPFLIWRTISLHNNSRSATIQAKLSESRLESERFTKAIELLSHDGVSSSGGIYTLEQISIEQSKYHWIVMETLVALIKSRSSLHLIQDGDVEGDTVLETKAAFRVLARRDSKNDPTNQPIRLTACNLRGVGAKGGQFSGAVLSKSDLFRAYLKDSDFSNAQMRGAKLSGIAFDRTNFSNAHMQHSNLSNSKCWKSKFNRSLLRYTVLDGTDFGQLEALEVQCRYAVGRKSSFRGANLENSSFRDCEFNESDFSNSNFVGASLYAGTFLSCRFSGAVMKSTSLQRGNFENSDFSNADLSSANLQNADFTGCRLDNVNMKNANIQGALFDYSTLGKVLNLTDRQKKSARINSDR